MNNQRKEGEIHTYIDAVRDSVMEDRLSFLRAVQELVPEVLADLERNVFPLFKALYREDSSGQLNETSVAVWGDSGAHVATLWIAWPSLREANQKGESWLGPSWASDIRGRELDSDWLAFKNAMEKWASKHYLGSESIIEDAFSTLCFWLCRHRIERIWLLPGSPVTKDELMNVPTLRIEDAWNFDAWPVVNKRLQERISVYKSEIRKYSQRIGFDLERRRKSPAHHQWLALFQCRGMSPQKIRDWEEEINKYSVDPTAVSHAIEILAKKIGLERRPGKSGRRRSR